MMFNLVHPLVATAARNAGVNVRENAARLSISPRWQTAPHRETGAVITAVHCLLTGLLEVLSIGWKARGERMASAEENDP
jgi:hypothetical protein